MSFGKLIRIRQIESTFLCEFQLSQTIKEIINYATLIEWTEWPCSESLDLIRWKGAGREAMPLNRRDNGWAPGLDGCILGWPSVNRELIGVYVCS